MDCILNQLDAFVDVDIKKCILEIDLRMNDKSVCNRTSTLFDIKYMKRDVKILLYIFIQTDLFASF